MPTTPLIVRTDIDNVVGSSNVTKWADLNNNRDADEITARIDYCIQLASEFILAKCRLLPHDLATIQASSIIKHAVALKAADLLYGPRRVDDTDVDKDLMSGYRKEAADIIKGIADATLDLGITRTNQPFPFVVKDENEICELQNRTFIIKGTD